MFSSRSRSRSQSPSAVPLNGLPINTKPTPRYSNRRSAVSFFGTAALTGIVFHLLFIGFGGGDAVREVPVLKEWLPPKPSTVTIVQEACPGSLDPIRTHSATLPKPTYHPPTTGSSSSSNTSKEKGNAAAGVELEESSDNTASMEELRKMISQTEGYYGRDYSLGLGWNNMRYIIEAALLQAQLLNRTLVLPSFVYARSCEWEINSCAAFATMVNRGDAIGWGEWRDLPIEKQMGWRIPMDTMLDIPHLRKTWPVILVREYLELHSMDPNKEWSNGAWHRTDYLAEKPDGSGKYTLFNVKNNAYDPENVVRVDRLEPLLQKGIKEDADTSSIGLKLYSMMTSKNSKNVIDFEDARSAIGDSMKDQHDDNELQQLVEANGWVVVHTYAGALGMDYLKSVVQPIKQVAPLRWVKGWQDDYKNAGTDIVVLEGETHLGRKPGGMRFTSEGARDDFARAVLYGLRPIDVVRQLADKVAQRMKEKTGGRMWMAGHMRRGDFVTAGWAMEGTIQKHFDRIKSRLAAGKVILEQIHTEQKLTPFDIPDVIPDPTQLSLPPPESSDVFFLATDERSEEGMKYVREHGAVLIGDLVTIDDRREFGWGIMVTDVLALVEQAVLSKAYYFYAHAMSSVAGGAVNMRAARGADSRSTLI
ncbi:hypothetical protein M407DRAFT_242976, partial [Tulasnella calospora MUT 4182]